MNPAWTPTTDIINHANITACMRAIGISDVNAFHRFTVTDQNTFWRMMIDQLHLVFKKPPTTICDLSHGVAEPIWFKGAMLNIADSCFTAPANELAIIYQDENK